MGNWTPSPPPPPPSYSCPTDYIRNYDQYTPVVAVPQCANVCDESEAIGYSIVNYNDFMAYGACNCACRIDPNSTTAANMNNNANAVNNSLSSDYERYLNIFNIESTFINNARNTVQLPDVSSSYNNMISAWTTYSNALNSFKDALSTYRTIPGYTRRWTNSTWTNAKSKLESAVNTINSSTYSNAKQVYINTKAAAEKTAAEKADANAIAADTIAKDKFKLLEDATNAEDTTFIKDAIAADKLMASLSAYNGMISSWTTYKNAVQSLKEALATYGTISGRNRISTNPTWVTAEKNKLTAENVINTSNYQDTKKAYILAKANAEAADKTANNTLNSILQEYVNDKANNITTTIENEITNTAQIATTFGVVSSYNDMKTAWTAYKTAYDDVMRSIQNYLNIKEKVSALNDYNKGKDVLAQSILTAKNNYNVSKNNFNGILLAAQKKARATEWMGTNRPGCRNLVSNSESVNNMQCNNNEYIYGFKSVDETYFYTCCEVPKGIVGTGGLPGFEGPQGLQGARGLQGPKGFQGPQGPQGPQGYQGEQGIKGESIRGPKGPPGKKGKQGAPGPRGASAELGKDVVIKSVAGPAGPKGVMGPRGPQGAPGAKGPMGERGRKGKDGKDAEEEEEDTEYISTPFNRSTIQLLDMNDQITNLLSKKRF